MKTINYLTLFLVISITSVRAEAPKSLDPNYRLDLFADNSMVSTPVGCTIDHSGRLLKQCLELRLSVSDFFV